MPSLWTATLAASDSHFIAMSSVKVSIWRVFLTNLIAFTAASTGATQM